MLWKQVWLQLFPGLNIITFKEKMFSLEQLLLFLLSCYFIKAFVHLLITRAAVCNSEDKQMIYLPSQPILLKIELSNYLTTVSYSIYLSLERFCFSSHFSINHLFWFAQTDNMVKQVRRNFFFLIEILRPLILQEPSEKLLLTFLILYISTPQQLLF